MVLTHPATTVAAPAPRRTGAGAYITRTVITDDGVALHCRDYPCTAGDPEHTVLLSPGFCLDLHSWDLQVDALQRDWSHRCRIITFDHRGHGSSQAAPIASYTIARLGSDIAQLLDSLGVRGSATFAGHSMGAMALLSYLAQPAAQRPVDPRGLVLVGTAGGALPRRGVGRALAFPALESMTALAAHVPGRYAPGTVRALVRPVCSVVSRIARLHPGEHDALLGTALRALSHTDVRAAAGFLVSLRDFDQRATLPDITAHTVVVSGALDMLTPPAFGAELAAAIPGATHVLRHESGHMLLIDAPHAITTALNRTIRHCLRTQRVGEA
ncbi:MULTISPECIES: alpha/beta fold hydrolase [Mycobacterium]|uniref:3-oxoadipate enol-lactonase n=3 Tax=Mycobacterium TaxID=1763 RepID=A0AA37PYD2_9MYCO|nr:MULTISPECIES: alpha/beta fold hydrolase [Mycobacterium]APA78436.1 alpha/beta fold hydrolase [Mycobacterium avium subsp. hominissuis]PBJ39103.1 alpha/beta hydrolase [Mycobacterium avium subsp. hominissuis]GLB86430.1 3-oxoadipate enol-lactonase [Mycobacterium kiyosense]